MVIGGSRYEVGFLLGMLHKKIIKSFESKIVNMDIEQGKVRRFEEILKKFDFIMEEIEGYCKGADIGFENLLKLRIEGFKILNSSCTSIFIGSQFIEEKLPVAMKIRDELPFPQYICKKHVNDQVGYLFSGSVSSIGYSFFVKENGFVGINNTGGFLKEEFVNEYGFDDCDIMRIIAESSNSVEETIEIIRKMQTDKMVGHTSRNRGMIFLFVDREKATLVEISSFDIRFKDIPDKVGFTNDFLLPESQEWVDNTKIDKSSVVRKQRLGELLQKGNINLRYLINVSRDKKNYPYSILRDTSLMPVRTISAFIVFLSEEPVVWINVGNPYISPFFPFFLKGKMVLDKFISGDISIRLNSVFDQKELNDEIYLQKIIKFEESLLEKVKCIDDSETKNTKIQQMVHDFIFSS